MPTNKTTLLPLLLLLLTPPANAARATLPGASLAQAHHWDSTRITALAERYEHGRGVKRDLHQAYALYCLSAARGDPEAAYSLGWIYLNGRGVTPDPARAATWLRQAAKGGIHHADRLLKRRLTRVKPGTDDACPQAGQTGIKRARLRRWVRALAPQYGLDSDLVEALVAAESSFKIRARSAKDARGLMQLLPATARRFGVKAIWDPVENLRGGMAYLRWLIERFDGQVPLALAAYNAGEHAVDRYQGIPPYKETQRYVQRITRQVTADSPHKPATTQKTKRHGRRSDRLARMLQTTKSGEKRLGVGHRFGH